MHLHPAIQTPAAQFINGLRDVGVYAYISSGKRTTAEQRALVASGASKTMNSKHLTGKAFDFDVVGWNRDALPRWWLDKVGEYGESLGLRWGGRFSGFYDGGHFEL